MKNTKFLKNKFEIMVIRNLLYSYVSMLKDIEDVVKGSIYDF